MLSAVKDGKTVDAKDVRKKQKDLGDRGDAWLREYRVGFVCGACGEPASYVSPALGEGGRGAHFRVRGGPECELHGPSEKKDRATDRDPETREGVLNEGGVVRVRYDALAGSGMSTTAPGGNKGASDSSQKGRHYVPGGGAATNHATSGLRQLLSHLRSQEDYPQATLKLEVPERGEVWATDYFCRFEDTTEDHTARLPGENHSRLMAYWGEITATRESGSLFLKGNGMDIMIYAHETAKFTEALGVSDHTKLVGWHVIAQGRLATSQINRRLLKVMDLKHIALLPPR